MRILIKKYSDKLELNQRPKDNHRTLQSSALPAELLSESTYLILDTVISLNSDGTKISLFLPSLTHILFTLLHENFINFLNI